MVQASWSSLCVSILGCWLLLLLPALTQQANSTEPVSDSADDTANGQSSRTCTSDTCSAARRPRWRYQPYGEERQKPWGGQYIKDEFKRHFTGPAFDDDWDVLWTRHFQVGELMKRKLPARPGRLINHCRYFRAAGQKCFFAGHVRRVQKALSRDPMRSSRFTSLRTYVLNHAEQKEEWWREAQHHPDRTWVVKGCSAGNSNGIELLRGDELLAAAEQWRNRVEKEGERQWTVAQEYLHRPYLGFGGRKFHLRVYVLVTRWGPPPSVLVYNEGVVFRSRHAYDHDRLSVKRDVFSRIASDVEAFPHATFWDSFDADEHENPGVPKRSAAETRAHMLEVIAAIFGEALDASFGDAIKETRPEVVGFGCFDLFGLDVMFDEDLRPYVLEVNTGPNLEIDDRGEESTGLLQGVKAPLIRQVVEWLAAYIDRQPLSDIDAQAIENATLVNFTRVV